MKTLRLYKLPSILIVAGAVLIAVVWKVTIKWIALPVFIIAALFILTGLTIAGKIAEAQLLEKHPGYKEPLGKQTIPERILHYAGFAFAISAYFAFTLLGRHIENIIGGVSFALYCAAIGLLLGFVYFRLLKIVYPSFIRNNEQRQGSILAFCLGIAVWSTFGFVWYNKQSIHVIQQKKVRVISKSKNARHGTPWLFLDIDGKEQRFSPVKKEWDKAREGDSVTIAYGKGKMGYEYIFSFRSAEVQGLKQ